MTVVTRFAPSPTGFLHIGGARTALFSWLFARAQKGKFLVRIEDTDHERSTQAAVAAILEGLDWLGLNSDAPPVFQSQRADRHREVAEALIMAGKAYRCPVSQEDLEARRQAASALKREKEIAAHADSSAGALDAARDLLLAPFRSAWRDPSIPLPDNAETVVRLRMPDEGPIVVEDRVQGRVDIPASELDDLILLRSDGTPTYMLAVVVDDHDMGVTHVIRGDDHFRNTFRQLPIYQAMAWEAPVFAHIPLIHGPDGKKLSKRHGALGVDGYRDLGYLPEGLRNYLLRLGWSHGDDELISDEQAISWFNLESLNKAPARLDFDKLNSVNAHYMAQAENERLSRLLLARPELSGISSAAAERLRSTMDVLKTRSANLEEMVGAAHFLTDLRPIELSGKAAKLLMDASRGLLQELTKELTNLDVWNDESVKSALDRYCAAAGIGIGKIGPVLRAVLTGGAPAPDLAIVLSRLGRDECLARIRDQVGDA